MFLATSAATNASMGPQSKLPADWRCTFAQISWNRAQPTPRRTNSSNRSVSAVPVRYCRSSNRPNPVAGAVTAGPAQAGAAKGNPMAPAPSTPAAAPASCRARRRVTVGRGPSVWVMPTNMRRPAAVVPGRCGRPAVDRAYLVVTNSPESVGHTARASHTIPSASSSAILAVETRPILRSCRRLATHAPSLNPSSATWLASIFAWPCAAV